MNQGGSVNLFSEKDSARHNHTAVLTPQPHPTCPNYFAEHDPVRGSPAEHAAAGMNESLLGHPKSFISDAAGVLVFVAGFVLRHEVCPDGDLVDEAGTQDLSQDLHLQAKICP